MGILRKLLEFALKTSGIDVNESSERGVLLVLFLAKQYTGMLLILLALGILMGVIEGGAIGAIAYSVIVITGDTVTCPASLDRMSSLFGTNWCVDYDKFQFFIIIIFFAVLIQVVKAMTMYVSGYISEVLRTRIIYQMRNKTVEHMFNLPYEVSSQYSAGEKHTLIMYSGRLASLVSLVNQVIVTFSVLIAYFILLIVIHWQLSIISFFVISSILFFVIPLLKKIREVSFGVREINNFFAKKVIDYMFALRLVKLYSKEQYVQNLVSDIVKKEVGLIRRNSLFSLALAPIQETFVIASVALIMLCSFYLAGDNVATLLPTTLAYVLVLYRCSARVTNVNALRNNFTKTMATIEYVTDFYAIEVPKKINNGIKKVGNNWQRIEFKDVNFSYRNSSSLQLENINCTIERGETIAFVGGSGAGKSTLVDLLVGLSEQKSGSVLIDDIDLRESDKSTWRAQFSMVSQSDLIINDTVRENLLFSNQGVSHEDIIAACKMVDAYDFIMSLDDGFDTILGERGARVSGGQIQRIAFARALLHGSPILVLDEATSALDSITEKKVVDSIEKIKEEKTIIMIAHRLSTVINADKIFLLDQGRIVASGSHDELKSSSQIYKRMWDLQKG